MPTTTNSSISAHYVIKLLQFLCANGYNKTALLANTQIPLDILPSEPIATLESEQQLPIQYIMALLHNAWQIKPDPSIGIRFGLQLGIAEHGFLGYGIRASRTLQDALYLAIRFSHTRLSMLVLDLQITQDVAILRVEERYKLDTFLSMVIDLLVASFFVIGEQVMASRGGVEVHLTSSEQPHHALLKRFGHTLLFNSAHNKFIIPLANLDFKLKSFDPILVQMATTQCEVEGKKVRIDNNLLLDVSRLAEVYLCTEKPFESISKALGLMPRTLRRHLSAHGTTYQKIVDELRQKLAIDKLLYSQLSIDNIASELGYQDPSNFGRAFRRWTGQSPQYFRVQQGVK